MLKAEVKTFLLLILLLQVEWSEAASYCIAFLAGMCVNTGYEWKKGTLNTKSFMIRLLFVCGLCPMVYFVWDRYAIKTDIVFAIFAVTLFSDFIVSVIISMGRVGIRQYLSNWLKVNPKDDGKHE